LRRSKARCVCGEETLRALDVGLPYGNLPIPIRQSRQAFSDAGRAAPSDAGGTRKPTMKRASRRDPMREQG
jgi:hypothetical protein